MATTAASCSKPLAFLTHALGDRSVAIDAIPSNECLDHEGARLTSDQRGTARDSLCDAGAFELVR